MQKKVHINKKAVDGSTKMTKVVQKEVKELKTFVCVCRREWDGILYRLLHEMLRVDELTRCCHAGTWHVHGHGLKTIKAL
jgi:hypothetical protein